MKKKSIAILSVIFLVCTILFMNNSHNLNSDKNNYSNSENTSSNNKNEEESKNDFLNENNNTIEGSSQSLVKTPDIIIKDDTFITQLDDIYVNLDEYIGKTLKIQGMIKVVEESNFSIIRLYDMPHDDHSHEVFVGIDATYSGNIPPEDTWVEASGIIDTQFKDGKKEPILKIQIISTIEAGQERVTY